MIPQPDPPPPGLAFAADDAPDIVVDLQRLRHAARCAIPVLYIVARNIRPANQADACRVHDICEDLWQALEGQLLDATLTDTLRGLIGKLEWHALPQCCDECDVAWRDEVLTFDERALLDALTTETAT